MPGTTLPNSSTTGAPLASCSIWRSASNWLTGRAGTTARISSLISLRRLPISLRRSCASNFCVGSSVLSFSSSPICRISSLSCTCSWFNCCMYCGVRLKASCSWRFFSSSAATRCASSVLALPNTSSARRCSLPRSKNLPAGDIAPPNTAPPIKLSTYSRRASASAIFKPACKRSINC